MIITLVVCTDMANGIGNKGKIPWHYTEELQHFRSLTENNTVVMGRKTFQSIGKPLKNRKNIVITRDKTFHHPDVTVYHSINEMLTNDDSEEIFVIGGSEIYSQLIPLADAICVSVINGEYECDTHFPVVNPEEWEETISYSIVENEVDFYQLIRNWAIEHDLH